MFYYLDNIILPLSGQGFLLFSLILTILADKNCENRTKKDSIVRMEPFRDRTFSDAALSEYRSSVDQNGLCDFSLLLDTVPEQFKC